MLDSHTVVVFANRAFRALVGLDESALLGMPAAALATSDERVQPNWARWLSVTLDTLALGDTSVSPAIPAQSEQAAGRTLRPHYLELQVSRLRMGESERQYCVVRGADVTGRRETRTQDDRAKALLRSKAQLRQLKIEEAEARLTETRDRLEHALTFAHVGTWELDFATGVIVCSDQCKRNLGLEPDALLNESRLLDDVIAPDDRQRVRRQIADAVEDGRPYLAEYRVTTAPGHWVLASGRVRFDAANQPIGMVGFTLDITDRKQQELEQGNQIVLERIGRELSERHALALDQFVSSVSHELRTPIGVILNWAEMLEVGADRFDILSVAEVFKRNARHLALMVDDLLDSGAIISGNLTIRKSRLRLDLILDEVCSDLAADANKKGLRLDIADLPETVVDADASRIRQIFWNLLTNAIKFSESGTISVGIEISDGVALCRVTDCGIGLAPSSVAVIFERFKQIESQRSPHNRGLGLGLWLVKNLVEQHGGSIAAHSAGEGAGSSFVVRLPLVTIPHRAISG